mmetsp:Transcript_19751/g.29324  ORF Transcript_19751/g.29324 Transcript_19751/m.29324 type:complete len:1152 (+) Transcript_19751:233-3688(+)|eukprot:CAMPEP_0194222904 /NCGR_PEP_ID=MMETSP0156-20130528/34026_1 /TAXON_ID=33649 /ORGANISM="Thalassionema nitzschioides, Strain L26-B" /LENGTH=1151 /DNA_ID=CAMNT_0038953875 /DNA_START=157 /DNA_END=3612 /DNA_ORIENTATION=-
MSSHSSTRVWVKSFAVDAIRNPKVNKFGSARSSSNSVSSSFSKVKRNYSHNSSFCDDDRSVSTSITLASVPTRGHQWGWMSGVLVDRTSKAVIVKLDDDDEVLELAATAMQDGVLVLGNDYENASQEPPSDLITLTHLHEPAVVNSLKQRYANDIIYTATGPVLIALNPFKPLRQLYSEQTMKKYWEKAEKNLNGDDLEPHVYQIADSSFRNMMRQMEDSLNEGTTLTANQAILVSGESGAGKTVTTKFVMKYLAALSKRASAPAVKAKRAYLQVEENKRLSQQMMTSPLPNKEDSKMIQFSSDSIESKVLQSNPILESFGNARTIRNDNSSRFGKFIEMQFTSSGKLVGATIETYLLEKVRLVTQSPGERNYHVFFELLQGMDKRELKKYYLSSSDRPDDFQMMSCSGTYDRRDRVSDTDTYRALKDAMKTMNFKPQEQVDIFSVTAALLHASNLVCLEKKGGHDDSSELDMTNPHLEPCCRLLGIPANGLNEALCTFSIKAGRETDVKRSLSQDKAEKELQAFIKATYGALFQYLVLRINDSIAYQPQDGDEDNIRNRPAATIGVLDIFGFESFATNSFEQLCINYCNEALQQQFNAFVLKNEQEEYEREGIEWSFIEFPENQDVLDLIDKRGSGILNILDDQCRAPGTSDRSFASDVYTKCTGHPRFQANRKQVAVLQFEVSHYAGPVEYSSDGFLEKNRDELHKESTELLANSDNPFVSFLSELLTDTNTASSNNTKKAEEPYRLRRIESSLSTTVGGQFRRQLKDLRSKIDDTTPHYVRCLKPNDHLVPDDYDEGIVAEQLRCGGILEAVRVSRAGFPQHYLHADFVQRYKCVAGGKDIKKKRSSSASSYSSQRPVWAPPVPQKTWTPARSFQQSASSPSPRKQDQQNKKSKITQVPYKEQCRDLLSIIYKKIKELEAEDSKGSDEVEECSEPPPTPITPVKAKPLAPWAQNVGKTPSPGSIKSRYQPWKQQHQPSQITAAPTRSSLSRDVDFTKAGLQLGKSKVFLRHKCFEMLERIRSRELARASTKLNSIFRMYLCRIAYLPVRDAYRAEFATGFAAFDDGKESKIDDESWNSPERRERGANASNLISQYENEFRMSFHDPNWMKKNKSKNKKIFKWVLEDGIWAKNPLVNDESIVEDDDQSY